MKKIKEKLFVRRTLIIALFVIFLFLRMFIDTSYSSLGADRIKYLELSQNFPYHTSSNNQIDLNHPPLFPYIIYFATLFLKEDYLSAIFVSILSASITFFILYRLFMMLSKNFYATLIALLFYTLSVDYIILARDTQKESFGIMLIILTIYYFIKGIKFNHTKSIIFSSIFGGLTALTFDHAIFLIPTLILAYIIFSKTSLKTLSFPNIRYLIIPLIVILLVYGSWMGVKAYQYSTNKYYPINLDGGPIETEGFGLPQLFDPHNFPDYEPNDPSGISMFTISDLKKYTYIFGYMLNTATFMIPRGLNFTSMEYLLLPKHIVYMIIFYVPFGILALFSFFIVIKNSIKTKKIYNNPRLFVIGAFFIFLLPILHKAASARYVFTSFIFFYLIFGMGIVQLSKKINFKFGSFKYMLLFLLILLLLIPVWYSSNPFFVFNQEKTIKMQKTNDFVNANIPLDSAIMGQACNILPVSYSTNHRVLGLPPKSEKLLEMIEYYDVDYIIHGTICTWEKRFYAINTIEFIRNNPDKFQLIKTLTEEYKKPEKTFTDKIYVYKVIR